MGRGFLSSYRTTLLLAFVGLAAIACTTLYLLLERLGERSTLEQIRNHVLGIAITVAEGIDGDVHDTILGEQAAQLPAYTAIEQQLRDARDSLRESGFDIAFIYSIRKNPKGWIYVVDPEEQADQKSLYGDRFIFTAINEADALIEYDGTPRVDRDFTQDEYGTFLSGFAPIKRSDGASVGLIGVDLRSSDVIAAKKAYLKGGLYGLLTAIILGALLSYLLSKWANKPLLRISNAIGEISNGNFDIRLPAQRRDEFGAVEKAVNDMADSFLQGDALKRALSRYASRDVAKDVIELGREPDLTCDGESREITVLFCDFHDFDSLSETLDPQDVVRFLNLFFKEMVAIVFEHKGTLDRYFGAGFMVTFGGYGKRENHALDALESATAIHKAVAQVAKEISIPQERVPKLSIAIHTGVAIIGEIGGSTDQMTLRAVGKAVDVSARVLGICRRSPHSTLITSPVVTATGESPFSFTKVDQLEAEGQEMPTDLFKIESPSA